MANAAHSRLLARESRLPFICLVESRTSAVLYMGPLSALTRFQARQAAKRLLAQPRSAVASHLYSSAQLVEVIHVSSDEK